MTKQSLLKGINDKKTNTVVLKLRCKGPREGIQYTKLVICNLSHNKKTEFY